MVKIKASVARKLGRKRVFKLTKGFYAQKKNRYGQAVRALNKAKRYATAHRKARTGDFRRLWIVRINAACQECGLVYSRLVKGLKEAKITINRKMLAELAVHDMAAFKKIAAAAEKALPANVTRRKIVRK
ncbi:MAG: 50S ribosomal protein L20 [Candidatus Omnitrophica bacterium]|nr:50S ribosomal protein L20 [Candidatus Omnitrophota bacterium]